MSEFVVGMIFGAGATVALGLICRSVLHANAERHFRAAYVATLRPDQLERLVNAEASGTLNWRQFKDREGAK
jgi:hypothetical protein